MARLEHKHHEDFANAPLLPFITEITGEVGGKVRTAGGPGAGKVSFVQIFDGGYVPPPPCVCPCVYAHGHVRLLVPVSTSWCVVLTQAPLMVLDTWPHTTSRRPHWSVRFLFAALRAETGGLTWVRIAGLQDMEIGSAGLAEQARVQCPRSPRR